MFYQHFNVMISLDQFLPTFLPMSALLSPNHVDSSQIEKAEALPPHYGNQPSSDEDVQPGTGQETDQSQSQQNGDSNVATSSSDNSSAEPKTIVIPDYKYPMLAFIQMILWAGMYISLTGLMLGMFLRFWDQHDHLQAFEFCFTIIPLLILIPAAFQVWALSLAALGWVKTDLLPSVQNLSEGRNYIFYLSASWFFLFVSSTTQFFVKHSTMFPDHDVLKAMFIFCWIATLASDIYLVVLMLKFPHL